MIRLAKIVCWLWVVVAAALPGVSHAGAWTLPVWHDANAPEVGDAAPAFESIDEFGRSWKSNKHVQHRIVVLFFYPGDFTTGCTKQAQSFRDNMDALSAKGIKVIGISGDLPATHQMFKEVHKLNYTLLSDPEGAVARRFGVPAGAGGKVRARTAEGQPLWDADRMSILIHRPVTLARWTLVLDRDGKVAYKNTNADPAKTSQEVLQFAEQLENRPK